mgnify:CR=1 FL=1
MADKSNERESLNDLRGEIDEIDEQLHDLLVRRGGLVERIRAVKRLESIATVRPGREAFILRKLKNRHKGNFPVGAVFRIWREIIAGITRMEMSEYNIAVYTAEGDQGYWDLARDQFGTMTPMTGYSSRRDVLRVVDEGNSTLGVVPCPSEDDTDPWWIGLMVPDGLRVAYKLPFFADTNARTTANGPAVAFAIGRILPEPSDSDRTLLVLVTEEPLSRAALADLTERAELPSTMLASSQQGDWFHLVEIDGFVSEKDERLTALNDTEEILRISVLMKKNILTICLKEPQKSTGIH